MDLKEALKIKQNTAKESLNGSSEEMQDFTGKTVELNGIQYQVISRMDSGYFQLLSLNSIPEHGVIARPIRCGSCKFIFWFDDSNIPDNEKYECTCPICKTLLLRKK